MATSMGFRRVAGPSAWELDIKPVPLYYRGEERRCYSHGFRLFDDDYSRIQRSFDGLKQMYRERRLPYLNPLTHHSSTRVHPVDSVNSFRRTKKKDGVPSTGVTKIADWKPSEKVDGAFEAFLRYDSDGHKTALPKLKERGVTRNWDTVFDVGNNKEISVPASQAISLNTRKHKAVEEPLLGDHTFKRQRNRLANSRNVCTKPEIGGQSIKPGNGVYNWKSNSGATPSVSPSASPPVSLPSMLKNIDQNHIILQQLIHNEKIRLASQSQLKTVGVACDPRNITNTNISPATSETAAPWKSSTEQSNSTVKPPLPSLNIPMVSPIHPKHSKWVKINGNLSNNGSETVLEQGLDAKTTQLLTHLAPQPDFSQLLTNKLEDPMPIAADFDGQETNSGGITGGIGVTQAPNPCGDIDPLGVVYDNEQIAARNKEQRKMIASRKLSLVLDLDHTLLNSAKFSEVGLLQEEKLRKMEQRDLKMPQRHLFRLEHLGLWTKLRPGVYNFLERARKLFELHICTMGSKLYATEMAKLLDPTGTLFAGRVSSRGDDLYLNDGVEMVPKSKDLDGVLGTESSAVIIDDCKTVWPDNKHNLIVVERYIYFPCSRQQFGISGKSLLEIDRDESVKDGTLASSLSVIERIHSNFFSHPNPEDVDVRNILASEQRKILSGCRILFSQIVRVGDPNPHLNSLWQKAEQFGAVCTNQIDEHVTHVVAKSRGTDKVNWALSTGRFVVQPRWVEASALLYRRMKEDDFLVKQ